MATIPTGSNNTTPQAERRAPKLLQCSLKGLEFIKAEEGLRLKPYKDQGGVWTVGYGHTTHVMPTDMITQKQADTYLLNDVATCEHAIWDDVKVGLYQREYDVLCSFIYNVGATRFARSDILRLVNGANYAAIPAALASWSKVRYVFDRGLFVRRKKEGQVWSGLI